MSSAVECRARPPWWVGLVLLSAFVPATAMSTWFQTEVGLSLWYPAAALTFTLLFWYGWRLVLLVVAVRVFCSYLVGSGHGAPHVMVATSTAAVCAYALAAALCVRLGADPLLRRARDAVLVCVSGALASVGSAAATIAVGRLLRGVPFHGYWQAVEDFTLGDAAAVLALAPALLILTARRPRIADLRRPAGWKAVEAGGALLLYAGGIWLSLRPGSDSGQLYPLLVPVVWLALRFGAAAATWTVCLGAAGQLLLARGAALTLGDVRTLETFEIVLACTAVIVGALESERRAAHLAALDATAAKSRFLAAISHEIRTPMNAVIGSASLLTDTTMTSYQRELVTTIRTSGEALLELINDVLDVSKIEADELQITPRRVRLLDLADEAVDLVAEAANAKSLDVTCTVDPDAPPHLELDVLRVRQILVNLLANAVKFTDSGHVSLSMRASRAAAGERDRLRITVSDTGMGIPADDLPRLFDPFTQVMRTDRRPGTGLGLAISRRLARAMGGDITVSSEIGRGSSFEVDLPLTPAADPDGFQAARTMLDRRAVLVVMAPGPLRQTLADQLIGWRAAVDVADTLDVVAELGGRSPWDVVIIDQDDLAPAFLTECQIPLLVLARSRALDLPDDCTTVRRPIRLGALARALAEVFGHVRIPAQRQPLQAGPADLRILVAEDNPINQRILGLMLDKLGYPTVRMVGNGADAVAALADDACDVVFMDVQMPVMNGLDATRRIRATTTAHRPWIIALTAGALSEDQDACAQAGTDAFLAKPITSGGLAAALADVPVAPRDPVLDHQVLDALFSSLGCGPDGATSFIAQFLDSCSTHIAQLSDALARHDLAEAARTAHALRSPAAMFGATALVRLLREIETWAGSPAPDPGRSTDFDRRISSHHPRLVDALGQWSLVAATS